jgi:hypothetical protein
VIGIVGEPVVEPDERFEVVLSNAVGAAMPGGSGAVTIVNDDATGGNLPTYEVRFTSTGYTGAMAGAPDCPVRKNGKVVMTGLVSGRENVARRRFRNTWSSPTRAVNDCC